MNSNAKNKRTALVLTLNALFWAFIMLLIGALWGKDASMWAIAGFVAANGLLLAAMTKSKR